MELTNTQILLIIFAVIIVIGFIVYRKRQSTSAPVVVLGTPNARLSSANARRSNTKTIEDIDAEFAGLMAKFKNRPTTD